LVWWKKKLTCSLQYVDGWTKWYSTIMSLHQYRFTFIKDATVKMGGSYSPTVPECPWSHKTKQGTIKPQSDWKS
jgi:hypothetical protein